MIKKILGFLAAVIVAVAAIVHVNIVSNREVLSDLLLANVEALANREDPTGDCKWHKEKCPASCWYCSGTEREVCLNDGDGNSCSCGDTTRPCD